MVERFGSFRIWIGLSALAGLLYANSFGIPFQLDDYVFLPDSEAWLKKAFGFGDDSQSVNQLGKLFRPVFWLSLQLDRLWLDPRISRAISVAVLVVAGVLFNNLVRRFASLEIAAAAAFALIGFSVHRQATTWIAARADSLSVAFGLAACLCVVRPGKLLTPRLALLAGVFAALSLGSKSTGIWCIPIIAGACLLSPGVRVRTALLSASPVILYVLWGWSFQGRLMPAYLGGLNFTWEALGMMLRTAAWTDLLTTFAADGGYLALGAIHVARWAVPVATVAAVGGALTLLVSLPLALRADLRGTLRLILLGMLFLLAGLVPVIYVCGNSIVGQSRLLLIPSLGAVLVFAAVVRTGSYGRFRAGIFFGFLLLGHVPWMDAENRASEIMRKDLHTCRELCSKGIVPAVLSRSVFWNGQPMLAGMIERATSAPFHDAPVHALYFDSMDVFALAGGLSQVPGPLQVLAGYSHDPLSPATPVLAAIPQEMLTAGGIFETHRSPTDADLFETEQPLLGRGCPFVEIELGGAARQELVSLTVTVLGQREHRVELHQVPNEGTLMIRWAQTGEAHLDASVRAVRLQFEGGASAPKVLACRLRKKELATTFDTRLERTEEGLRTLTEWPIGWEIEICVLIPNAEPYRTRLPAHGEALTRASADLVRLVQLRNREVIARGFLGGVSVHYRAIRASGGPETIGERTWLVLEGMK